MKKLSLLVLLITSFFTRSQSGDIPFQPGAAAGGMGMAQVASFSPWATHYNPGLIPWAETGTFAIGVDNRFLVSELSGQGFAGIMPIKNSAVGLSFTHYGFSQYNRSRIGGSYGLKLSEHMAAGISMHYDLLSLGGIYGKGSAISASLGFSAKVNDDLMLAASVFNPFRASFSNNIEENLPALLNIGVNYKFSEKVNMSAELEKDINQRPGMKLGLEYLPIEILYLRAGFKTLPQSYTFGVGLQLKQIKIDIASWVHPVLGVSPMLSIQYDLAK